MTRVVALVAAGVLLASLSLPGQDVARLKSRLDKAAHATDQKQQKAAAFALAAVPDPRLAKEFARAVASAEKLHARLVKKIVKLGGKRKSIWKSVDRQASAGRGVRGGSVVNPMRKDAALKRQLDPLYQRLDQVEGWHSVLLQAWGRLVEGLPDEQRQKQVLALADVAENARGSEDRLRVIRILEGTRASEAREALAELAARAEDQDVRIAATDALGARGEAASAAAVAVGLKDDAWQVRVAAAQALSAIPSTAGVPLLIEALGKAEGRVLDEVQEALEDLTGSTFFDNQTLWKEWWKKHGQGFSDTLSQLDEKRTGRRASAMLSIGTSGFLAGARRVLRIYGLGPRSPLDRKTAKGVPAPTSQDVRQAALEAVATAISSRKKRIRERAFLALLWRPWNTEESFDRRLDYLKLLGPMRTERALRALADFAEPGPLEDPVTDSPYTKDKRRKLRLAAIAALGHQEHEDAVQVLHATLDDLDADTGLKAVAIGALRGIRTRESVGALVRALSDHDGELFAKLTGALEALTGKSFGTDKTEWRRWFRGLDEDWKPGGAATAKGGEGDKPGSHSGTTFYGIESRSKHLVYIIDVSGSMNQTDAGSGRETRISVARSELIQSIRSLDETATFNIIFYNHEHAVWNKRMVQATRENKKAATDWVASKDAMGATNIFDPIEHAFELAGRGTHDKRYGVVLDTIFFLSDGQPNRGRIVNPQEIVKEVSRMNTLKKVKIHAVGIGRDHNAEFMRALADLTGGTYVSKM